MAGAQTYLKKLSMSRRMARASLALSVRPVLTSVVQPLETSKRTSSSVPATTLSLRRMELGSAGPHCEGWMRWKHRLRMGNCKFDFNIFGSSYLTRKSSGNVLRLYDRNKHAAAVRVRRAGMAKPAHWFG